MKANKQSKIKVPKSGFKRSKFNWNHDVNTTFNWGEIQPTQCKLIQSGSKTTMKAQSLIRLAPMVAPTFGRVKYKTFNQFVPVSDIFENFASMMSQEPVNRNGRIKVAQKIPSIKLGQLSAYCFLGARSTLYWVDEVAYNTNNARKIAASEGKYLTAFRKSMNASPNATATTMLGYLNSTNGFQSIATSGIWDNIPGAPRLAPASDLDAQYTVVMNPKVLKSDSWDAVWQGTQTYAAGDYQIALGNFSSNSNLLTLLPPAPEFIGLNNIDPQNPSNCYITFDGADYVIEFKVTTGTGDDAQDHYYALCLEFSDFGKRIRKVLQGAGYQIDISSAERVSILPLLAQYKAYFDIFGLQLYQGWETTYCAKLIDYIKNNFIEILDIESFDGQATDAIRMAGFTPTRIQSMDGLRSAFLSFMLAEVANEWYTEDPDFIGAHQSKLAISPNGPVDSGNGFISVDADGIDIDAHVQNSVSTQGGTLIDYGQEDTNLDSGMLPLNTTSNSVHAFINQVQHGQVDADLLKRLYRWTNRNTVLGREIAKILRAQGLGKYVDECKSDFIGSTDNMITISDVVSMADTDQVVGTDPDTGRTITSGAVLGEYGGKGLQYIEDKVLVFENDELGYWVTLATVVPEAGYTQGLDPTLKCLDKFSMYNPDFDALGMELNTKDVVVGNSYVCKAVNDDAGSSSFKGFGFVPRYSKFKVASNLVNGDFNRHNMRSTYLPYTLDKQISAEDYVVRKQTVRTLANNDVIGEVNITHTIGKERLPVAGNIYRIPTKYPWMGNFSRIFMNVGMRELDQFGTTGGYWGEVPIGFHDYNSDNFLSHEIMEISCYAPMKPIEDSYGLDEDESPISGVEFVTKA